MVTTQTVGNVSLVVVKRRCEGLLHADNQNDAELGLLALLQVGGIHI